LATRIQLCGCLVATVAGRNIEEDLPGRLGRLLFAYLVLHRLRPAPRNQLLTALWPETLPSAPEASVNALLSRLRRLAPLEGRAEVWLDLEPGAFVDLEAASEAIHRAEAAVRRCAWVDAWAPARVALHTANRGFFPGEDFPWVDEQQRRLENLRIRAHECIAQTGLGLGGPELDATLRSARALIALAPFHESGHRLLMQALEQQGNVADALAVYEQLRMTLRDELGVAPSLATQQLYRALLG